MFKKFLVLTVFVLLGSILQAQGLEESTRYSTQGLGGSTRSLGSANAFGAIGGDFICGSINPAGLALNRKSELHFGLNINSNATQSSYIGSPAQGDVNVGLGLSNAGITINGFMRDNAGKRVTDGLTNLVFSFGYNRHSDYRSNFVYSGDNKQSSFTDYLAENANGQDYKNMNSYSLGYLSYMSYLIEPKINFEDSFASGIASPITNVRQNNTVTRKGSGGDYNLSLAGDFSNKFYFGMGLLIRSQRYTESFQFFEKDLQPKTDTNAFESMTYSRYLNTKTSGVGFNIGGLLKATENIRFGISYTTPIVVKATDKYTQTLVSSFDNARGNIPEKTYTYSTPDDNFDGKPDTLQYKYKVSTPAKVTLSGAYIFEKKGFISVDLERVNYASSKLIPVDDPTYLFIAENEQIRTIYKAVWNVRIGAEYVYDKYRFRVGYAINPSPYTDNRPSQVSKLNRNFYTVGLGYYDKGYSINAAVLVTSNKENYTPYKLNLGRTYYAADIKNSFVSFQFGATIVVD